MYNGTTQGLTEDMVLKSFFSFRGAGFVLMIFLSALAAEDTSGKECYVSVTNAAEPRDGTVFRIVTESTGFDPSVMEVTAGEGFGKTLAEGSGMTLRMDVPPGWYLESAACETAERVSVTETEEGITVECGEGSGAGMTTCAFTSVRAEEEDVPALGEFGAIGVGILLGLVGAVLVYLKHRPRRWR